MSNISVVGVSFLVILLFLANPFGLWTPDTWQYIAVTALAVVGIIFAGIVFRGHNGDERESQVRDQAARSGYLAGVLVLTAAVVTSVLHSMEPNLWLIGALAAMVGARLATHLLSE